MYDKILCIFPVDPTTDFLNLIPISIKEYFGDRFELYRIDASDDSYQIALYKMQNIPNDSLIIYLGHGNHTGFHCFHTSINGSDDEEGLIFLNSQNIQRIVSVSFPESWPFKNRVGQAP